MNLPVPKSVCSLAKTIFVCSVSLCFAAAAPAAFAQRGGGHGGGGHASHGGFHPGSAHISTGSSGHASGSRSPSHGSAGAVSLSTSSARGFTHNLFIPRGSSRVGNDAGSFTFRATAAGPQGARPFAANNYLWEDAPQQGRPVAPPMQSPRPIAPLQAPRPFMPMQTARPALVPTRARSAAIPLGQVHFPVVRQGIAPGLRPFSSLHRAPLGITPPARRFASGTPFAGVAAFHPQFHSGGFGPRPCIGPLNHCGIGGGFGFGFGSPFFSDPFFFSPFGFGFGPPCFSDGGFQPCAFGPFGGFAPFGLNWDVLGYGYDFGNGYFYSPAEAPPPPPSNAVETTPPANFSNESDQYPYMPPPERPIVPYSGPTQNNAAAQPVVKLVLKDGTVFDVNSYWLADGRLNYITTYNMQTSISIDDLDLQKTVDMNYKLGITFTLTPEPPGSSQPQQQSPPQNQ